MFGRYVLRTIELEGARRFYEVALGLALPDGAAAETSLEAWPLHEQARKAGAPPHWLGQLEVDDVEGAVREMVAMGAQAAPRRRRARDSTTGASQCARTRRARRSV